MSPSRSITGVRIRTVRPSSSVKVTGLMSLVGQPCQLPVFLALAGSELTGWSMRRKSGTAPSTFEITTLLLMPCCWCATAALLAYITLIRYQPLPQLRPPISCPRSLNGDRQRLPLSDEHHQTFAARHPRVDQVPLQHRIVLRRHRDDHGRMFRTLALVDRRRVSKNQLIELTKAVGDLAALEIDSELAFL